MSNLSYQPCNKCLHFKWSVVFLIHRIMASLNLLRYLVIKDCESDNQVSSNWFETDWFLISRGLRVSSSQKHVFCIFLPNAQQSRRFYLAVFRNVQCIILSWWNMVAFIFNCYHKQANSFTLPNEIWSLSSMSP